MGASHRDRRYRDIHNHSWNNTPPKLALSHIQPLCSRCRSLCVISYPCDNRNHSKACYSMGNNLSIGGSHRAPSRCCMRRRLQNYMKHYAFQCQCLGRKLSNKRPKRQRSMSSNSSTTESHQVELTYRIRLRPQSCTQRSAFGCRSPRHSLSSKRPKQACSTSKIRSYMSAPCLPAASCRKHLQP